MLYRTVRLNQIRECYDILIHGEKYIAVRDTWTGVFHCPFYNCSVGNPYHGQSWTQGWPSKWVFTQKGIPSNAIKWQCEKDTYFSGMQSHGTGYPILRQTPKEYVYYINMHIHISYVVFHRKCTQVEKNEDVYFYIATLNNQRVWTGGLRIWKSVENTEWNRTYTN